MPLGLGTDKLAVVPSLPPLQALGAVGWALMRSSSLIPPQARFSLWQCDHTNHVEAAAVRGSRQLKVLRLAVRDVRSRNPACPGALLGAVAYADTFLEVGGWGEGGGEKGLPL